MNLSHIRTWIFDLDNTLYPPAVRLFDQIEVRMTDWVQRALGIDRSEADRLRDHYWRVHGTTLAGLMREHGVDPAPYLLDVHDIDFSGLTPDPALRAAIEALPGRAIVFTNGTAAYAHEVTAALGLGNLFPAIYGVEEAGMVPKPDRAAFDAIVARDGLDPTTAAMFEDDARNLAAPHDLGMATIHVAPVPVPAPHIHHHTANLREFLGQIAAEGWAISTDRPISA